MKKANRNSGRNLALAAAALLAALNLQGAESGAPDTEKPVASPLPATTPPEIIKPALPSDLLSADAVFDELDAGRRGYVTRADTKDLLGFGDAFRAADSRRSGKLTRAQFRKAWAIYKSGNK